MTLARIIKDSMNMEKLLQLNIPKCLLHLLKKFSINTRRIKYRIIRRPCKCGETTKAKSRRIKERFFERYCRGKGLDIGYGGDLLTENCQGFDVEDGDAQYLAGLKNEAFDFVYSSHTLEHLFEPQIAIQNWWRVLKSGGYLILYLPERDLYEKKKTLPSRWNVSHEHFFYLIETNHPTQLG